mmetsp:Transcript_24551/g.62166  ORF Transcript_24551/g.62166 Transcript_24551/m.62166 type:complete len:411 (-) Transcript_24551:646-1878(-)
MSTSTRITDTTYTKIFVGGLAWVTNSDSLRSYFSQFGEIADCAVIIDKHTGNSKGYGFVTFSEAEAATRACMIPNPVIDGRRCNINLAALGRKKENETARKPRDQKQVVRGNEGMVGRSYMEPILGMPTDINAVSMGGKGSQLAAGGHFGEALASNMFPGQLPQPAVFHGRVPVPIQGQPLPFSGDQTSSNFSGGYLVGPNMPPQSYPPQHHQAEMGAFSGDGANHGNSANPAEPRTLEQLQRMWSEPVQGGRVELKNGERYSLQGGMLATMSSGGVPASYQTQGVAIMSQPRAALGDYNVYGQPMEAQQPLAKSAPNSFPIKNDLAYGEYSQMQDMTDANATRVPGFASYNEGSALRPIDANSAGSLAAGDGGVGGDGMKMYTNGSHPAPYFAPPGTMYQGGVSGWKGY